MSGSSGPEGPMEGWEGWLPGHSHTPWRGLQGQLDPFAGKQGGSLELSPDPLPSCQSFNPPAPHLSCQVPTKYGPTVTLSLAVSLTRVPLENDPTWARRWLGMKSSRLSPAG